LPRISKLPWFEVSAIARILCRLHPDLLTVSYSLAMAEMSLVLAMLFRPGAPNLVIFETDESDVKHVHDFVIPLPKLSTKGVRVMVL
jgi:hypothetical protein